MAAAAARPEPRKPDDPTEDPWRVHRPPQAQVVRTAERQAEPEDDRDRDHHRRAREHGEQQERGRAARPDQRQLVARPWPDLAGEGAQQVRDERCGGEGGQPDRLEAAAACDRREQGRDQGGRHPDPDRCDRVEGKVAPDRALLARRREGEPAGSRVPRSSPSGLRGELSGSALGSPSRRSRLAPGIWVPRPPRGGSAISYGISRVGFVATTRWSGVATRPIGPSPASGSASGRAGSVEHQRPVRVGFDHPVGGLAVVLGPRREEGDAAGEMIRGSLQLQPGTRQAGRTTGSVAFWRSHEMSITRLRSSGSGRKPRR